MSSAVASSSDALVDKLLFDMLARCETTPVPAQPLVDKRLVLFMVVLLPAEASKTDAFAFRLAAKRPLGELIAPSTIDSWPMS